MNKIIFSSIFIITLFTNYHSTDTSAIINNIGGANQAHENQRVHIAQQNAIHQPENNPYQNMFTLEELRRLFIAQPTHTAKAEFITQVLEHEIEPINAVTQPITVGQQLINAQNLKTIIQQEIYLKSGYLWNSSENKPEIEWLENQITLIDHKIALLKWQSRSFGAQALWTTAKWLAIYLGVIATIYAAQPYIEKSYNALHPNEEKYKPKSIGELAVIGPNALYETTKQAVGYTYSPKVQDGLKTTTHAAKQAGSNLLSGLSDIGSKGTQFTKEKLHNIAQGILGATKPNKTISQANETSEENNSSNNYPIKEKKADLEKQSKEADQLKPKPTPEKLADLEKQLEKAYHQVTQANHIKNKLVQDAQIDIEKAIAAKKIEAQNDPEFKMILSKTKLNENNAKDTQDINNFLLEFTAKQKATAEIDKINKNFQQDLQNVDKKYQYIQASNTIKEITNKINEIYIEKESLQLLKKEKELLIDTLENNKKEFTDQDSYQKYYDDYKHTVDRMEALKANKKLSYEDEIKLKKQINSLLNTHKTKGLIFGDEENTEPLKVLLNNIDAIDLQIQSYQNQIENIDKILLSK